jgi:hypothetical protein
MKMNVEQAMLEPPAGKRVLIKGWETGMRKKQNYHIEEMGCYVN